MTIRDYCAAAALVLLLAPAARADMFPDASNAKLPTARANLCPTRAIATGRTATAAVTDCALVWRSAEENPKATSIPGCSAAINGMTLEIIDGQHTAALYPVTITPAAPSTVWGDSSLTIAANGAAVTLVCNGANTEWVIK